MMLCKFNKFFYTMKNLLLLSFFIIFSTSCSMDDDSSSATNSNSNSSTNSTSTSNNLSVGASANGLLSADKFTSMVVEIVYVEGFQPTTTAVNNFVTFLNNRTFKPNGITVQQRSIPSPNLSTYTIQQIIDIENANRTAFSTENQIAVWAYFSDGASSGNSGNSVVLGTAYKNTSFVIFEETIHGLSDSTFEPERSDIESTVIQHEFGHIFGLTDLGSPLQSQHEDQAHPKHCDVDTCLMFWQAETGSGIMGMVSGGNIPQLDAQCIADLQANGGK